MIALKAIASLSEKKNREEQGLFLAEGPDVVSCLLDCAYPLESLLIDEAKGDKFKDLVRSAKTQVHMIPTASFGKISSTEATQGIAALARIRRDPVPEKGPFVYLDRVQDPGNVGAVARTAAAAGFTAVIAGNGCADFYSPKVVRGSAGAIAAVACVEDRDGKFLVKLHERKWDIVVTDCEKGVDFRTLALKDHSVLIMGNEGEGVSPACAALATQRVHIPLTGKVQSLNVAVSFGILAFNNKDDR